MLHASLTPTEVIEQENGAEFGSSAKLRKVMRDALRTNTPVDFLTIE